MCVFISWSPSLTEFNTHNPHNIKGEMTPVSCPLLSTKSWYKGKRSTTLSQTVRKTTWRLKKPASSWCHQVGLLLHRLTRILWHFLLPSLQLDQLLLTTRVHPDPLRLPAPTSEPPARSTFSKPKGLPELTLRIPPNRPASPSHRPTGFLQNFLSRRHHIDIFFFYPQSCPSPAGLPSPYTTSLVSSFLPYRSS